MPVMLNHVKLDYYCAWGSPGGPDRTEGGSETRKFRKNDEAAVLGASAGRNGTAGADAGGVPEVPRGAEVAGTAWLT